MIAREVKAFIHRNRVADVVNALNNAGFRNISVADVQGLLQAMSSKEQSDSVEIGQKVVHDVKLELAATTSRAPSRPSATTRKLGNRRPVGFSLAKSNPVLR